MRLVITGTDTNIGKTTIAVAILEQLTEWGWRCAAIKPAESGCGPKESNQDPGINTLHPADAERLRIAAGNWQTLENVCQYRYAAPVAPGVAAASQNESISFEVINKQIDQAVSDGAEAIIVEGAGGLLVPMSPTTTFANLIRNIDYPALVVADARLGTINHSLLTIEALQNRGIQPAGVILTATQPTDRTFMESNAQQISAHGGVPILGLIDHCKNPVAAARKTINFELLIKRCST